MSDKQEKFHLTKFVKVIGHELKHPITALKAYLYLIKSQTNKLQQRHEDEDLSQIYDNLEKADRQLETLTSMLNELADLSKISIDQLQIDLTEHELTQLVAGVVAEFQALYPHRQIGFKTCEPVQVQLDEVRFRQALINLITNAIKHTPDDTEVTIKVEADHEIVSVSVKDNGPGIAPTDLEKIFEPYFQVENHEKRKEGLGLGLFIAQTIVNKHRGKLAAVSQVGEGTEFIVTLKKFLADPKQ